MNIFARAVSLYSNSLFSKFIFNSIGLYILWYFFYVNPTEIAALIDKAMLVHLTQFSKFLLSLMGFELFESRNFIFGIVGSSGVWIGPPCNGISLMALFLGFIVAFPSSIKNKLKIGIIGLLIIHVLNILRILTLVIMAYYHREWLEFNHDYTFTLIIYVVTFTLWFLWVKNLPRKNKATS